MRDSLTCLKISAGHLLITESRCLKRYTHKQHTNVERMYIANIILARAEKRFMGAQVLHSLLQGDSNYGSCCVGFR